MITGKTGKRIALGAGVILLVAVAAIALSLHLRWEARKAAAFLPENLPSAEMRDGDLVFRTGTGDYSRMINIESDSVRYSHIGFLLSRDSSWYVIHAVPKELEGPDDFERVKMEPLLSFLSRERCLHGAFVHTGIPCTERMAARALQYARDSVAFDQAFDLKDSSRIYCTELIWRLYLLEGVDLSQGLRRYRNFLIFNDEGCILPNDLLEYPGNTLYYQY